VVLQCLLVPGDSRHILRNAIVDRQGYAVNHRHDLTQKSNAEFTQRKVQLTNSPFPPFLICIRTRVLSEVHFAVTLYIWRACGGGRRRSRFGRSC
jgi:hypothetical protein